MRVRRLELLWITPLEPKSSASTNFAIPAKPKRNSLIHRVIARERRVGAFQFRFNPACGNCQCRNQQKSQEYFFHNGIIARKFHDCQIFATGNFFYVNFMLKCPCGGQGVEKIQINARFIPADNFFWTAQHLRFVFRNFFHIVHNAVGHERDFGRFHIQIV